MLDKLTVFDLERIILLAHSVRAGKLVEIGEVIVPSKQSQRPYSILGWKDGNARNLTLDNDALEGSIPTEFFPRANLMSYG